MEEFEDMESSDFEGMVSRPSELFFLQKVSWNSQKVLEVMKRG